MKRLSLYAWIVHFYIPLNVHFYSIIYIRKFEEKNNGLVYHVIKTQMNFGLMYSFLYVSEHIEEWQMDMEDLGDNQTLAYVVNTTMPDCSEFGTIGIEPSIGGLKRIW